MRIPLRLWLHREERDAWLVSLSGIGAGEWLPKSLIDVPDGAVGGLNGPVEVMVEQWAAEDRRLATRGDGDEPGLF